MHKGLSQTQWALLRSFKKGESSNLKRLLPKLKPSEIVQVFARMGKSDQIRMLELLFELGMARPALKKLPEELAKDILAGISDDTIQEDVRGLSAEETSDLLEYLPAKRQEGILEGLDARQRWLVTRERLYDKDTAAGRMTTDYVTFPQEMTAGEVIGELRRRYDKADLHDVYIVDDVDRIKGVLSLRRLVFASPEEKIRDLMFTDPICLRPEAKKEEVARLVLDFDLLAIPVVSNEGRMLGVVPFDEIADVLEEEATEDVYRLANLNTAERVFTPLARSIRLRTPWLLLNLGTAIMASLTVSLFKDTISKFVTLAVLMPIVSGMGGNAGAQSLTVLVRSLAIGEFKFVRRRKAVLKEAAVGAFTGSINGLVMGLLAYLWFRNLWLSFAIFLAMLGNLILGGFVGALVPLLLAWRGKDPALGSSVLVTTATDVGGFFLFLGLATLLIQRLTMGN